MVRRRNWLSQARVRSTTQRCFAQSLAGINHPASDAALDAVPAQVGTAVGKIAGFIGVELFRPAPRPASRAADGRDRFHDLFKEEAVVAVGSRELHGKRDAFSLDHKMALRARFAAMRRIRPGELAPLFAGMLALSSAARLQSIWSVSPRKLSSSWLDALPGSILPCHSFNLRQQVIPLPQPISLGSTVPRGFRS
jgi:hypothetical protein